MARTLRMVDESLGDRPMIWKVGVTTNPVWRLSVYMDEKPSCWNVMVLFDHSIERFSIEMEEAAIVQMYYAVGNRNVASGGEGHKTKNQGEEGCGCWLYLMPGAA